MLKKIKLKDLVPFDKNPRINDKAVDRVLESLKANGYVSPIVVNEIGHPFKEHVIAAGHTRWKALDKFGSKEVEVFVYKFDSEKHFVRYNIEDNKTAEFAEWDETVLAELSAEFDIDLDAMEFEFDVEEEPNEGLTDEDEVPEVPEEPVAKLGQVWKLGEHRLMCGDSTDKATVAALMDGEEADLVFTDPPYNIETKGGCKGSIGNGLKKQGEDISFIADFEPSKFLECLPSVFSKKMNAYIFCNKQLLPDYLNWANDKGYSFNVLIWKKPTAIPIGDSHRPDIEYILLFRKSAIWNNGLKNVNYSRCLEFGREKGLHPTMKPIELIENEVYISSKVGSLVMDFFGGSGSTLIACEKTKRKCRMMELDPKYCDVIIKRWQSFTGQKAILCDNGKTFDEMNNA